MASKGKKVEIPGLQVRIDAARALSEILRGASFEPLGVSDIADPRDRALANKLVTVALVRHGHLNQIISALLERGCPARSGLFEAILRLGLTQLLFMSDQADHSALHLSVEAVRRDRRGGRYDRLLNGVLRQAQREKEKWQALELETLFPSWLQGAWRAQYGQDNLKRFGEALLAGAPLDLSLKENDPALVAALGGVSLASGSVRVAMRDRPVAQMAGFAEGQWWVQDAAAAMPARLLNLSKGARVLDMCAAPGGKTAQLIQAGYEVSALDLDPSRLVRLRKNLGRLNYSAQLIEADARTYQAPEKFEGILLDAPCSATGTFRRHPELVWHRTNKDIAGRVALQRQMIKNAVANLADGGILVFCTCSLQKEEGEEQADWVLHNFPQLRNDPLPTGAKDGLERFIDPKGYLRTHPGMEVSSRVEEETILGSLDGFFAARFRN